MNQFQALINLIPYVEKYAPHQHDDELHIKRLFNETMMKLLMDDSLAEHNQASIEVQGEVEQLGTEQIIAYLIQCHNDKNELHKAMVNGALQKCLVQLQTCSLSQSTFKLNELFNLPDLANTKIRMHVVFDNNWNPIDSFKNGDIQGLLTGQYWNFSKRKSYKVGETTIGLIRLFPRKDLWLLFHIGVVTEDLNIYEGAGYRFRTLNQYSKYFGRVIVKYKNTTQALIRKAENIIDQCEIYQILPDVFDNDIFPGYENVNVSWDELKRVIEKESWRTALNNQKAVYLITDTSNGKMYVGSATAEQMLLDRWTTYARNRHGGNIQLTQLSAEHIEKYFRYSILDIFKSTTDDQIILNRENWWKQTLLTRIFGYNSN